MATIAMLYGLRFDGRWLLCMRSAMAGLMIRLSSRRIRRFSFRVDAFNLFNTAVINAANTTIQLGSPAAPSTTTNNQYNSDGSLNTARLTAVNAGFGAATGALAMRTIQAQIRITF